MRRDDGIRVFSPLLFLPLLEVRLCPGPIYTPPHRPGRVFVAQFRWQPFTELRKKFPAVRQVVFPSVRADPEEFVQRLRTVAVVGDVVDHRGIDEERDEARGVGFQRQTHHVVEQARALDEFAPIIDVLRRPMIGELPDLISYVVAIGTLAGGEAAVHSAANWIVMPAVLGFAALCVAAAYRIPSTRTGSPNLTINRNPLTSTWHLLAELKSDRPSWIGGLIVSWFWLVGIVVLTLLPVMVKDKLNGAPQDLNLALALFTVGIAAGSVAAARMSKLRPNLALVPAGALLMALFGGDLALSLAATAPPADKFREWMVQPRTVR